jgi:hypothetical protein
VPVSDEIFQMDLRITFPPEFHAVEFADLIPVEAVIFKRGSQLQDAVFLYAASG